MAQFNDTQPIEAGDFPDTQPVDDDGGGPDSPITPMRPRTGARLDDDVDKMVGFLQAVQNAGPGAVAELERSVLPRGARRVIDLTCDEDDAVPAGLEPPKLVRSAPKRRAKRFRAIMFTIFTDAEEWYNGWVQPKEVAFTRFQLEECPITHALHIQGYMEFHGQETLNDIKRLLERNDAHIEVRRGSQAQAIAYVSKTESRVREPKSFGKPARQGKRKDLDDVADAVAAGRPVAEIASEFPSEFIRYGRGIIGLHLALHPPRYRGKPKIYFIWGPSGCGKSRLANILWPNAYYYLDTPQAWFDGYAQQDVVHLEDFKGHMPLAILLRLIDYYQLQLQVKNGWTAIYATTFVFTCNEHYNVFYTGHTAWLRRIEDFGEVWDETTVKDKLTAELALQQAHEAAINPPDNLDLLLAAATSPFPFPPTDDQQWNSQLDL